MGRTLDRTAGPGVLQFLRDGERSVEVVGLHHNDAGQEFLGLDERPVSEQRPPLAVSHGRGRPVRVQASPAGHIGPGEHVGNRAFHRADVGPLAAVCEQCVLHNPSSH